MKKYLAILISLLFVVSLFGVASVFGKSGGPDGFGYTFIDSNDDPLLKSYYPWIEIKDTGTKITWIGGCDNGTINNVPLGFNFNFYGTNVSKVNLSANGWAQLGQFGYINAFLWDLSPCCENSNVYYETKEIGGRKVFVLEYYQVPRHSDSSCDNPRNTFQLQLYEGSNNIVMVYKTMDSSIPNPDIGNLNVFPDVDLLSYSSPLDGTMPQDGTVIIFQYPGSERYSPQQMAQQISLPVEQILKILKGNQ